MIEVKAPEPYSEHKGLPSVFLAGSIEMGRAEHWQRRVIEAMAHLDVVLLNPRRENWDPRWEQDIENPDFRRQVEWELSALEYADHVIMYFAPQTKSPITLLELGFHTAANPDKLIVCCPHGFWRKGNVDVICRRYGVEQAETLEELMAVVMRRIRGD